MAASTLNFALKTVNDRAVRSCVTVTATDSDYTGTAFQVPIGTPLTLIVAATAAGSSGSNFKLQGSVDGINFATIKDINVVTSTGDLQAAGVLAEVHLPAVTGDWPWYRLYIDNNTSNGSAGTCWILQG